MKTKFWCMLILLFSSRATAQYAGDIKGKIADERTKSPLQGVNVTVSGTALGSATDSLGEYFIHTVPEGLYEIKISCIGRMTFIKPDIRVLRSKVTQVPEIALNESSIESDGMTVTAGTFQDNNDMPVSSFNLTKDEIHRSPGAAGDIFRALSTLPGVSTQGGEICAFSVRGGGPRDNLILVDNIPFTKVSHFDDGGIDGQESQGGRFGIFAPTIIEKADFSAGGFPARYGSKNSSIINMDIKEGNYTDATAYGHYDLFGWETNYDGPLPFFNKTGLLVSARHVDFRTILDMIGEKGEGNPNYTDVLLKSTTEITPSHKISFVGIYSDDQYVRTIDNVFASNDINKNQLRNHKDARSLVGINERALIGTVGFLQSTAYFYWNGLKGKQGRVNTAFDYGVVPTKENSFMNDDMSETAVQERTGGFKSDITLSLGSHGDLFTGIEAKRNTYHYTMTLNSVDTFYVFDRFDARPDPAKEYIIVTPQQYNQDNHFHTDYYALYTELSLKIDPVVTVNPGIRFERYTYDSRNYISPRISIRYQMTLELSLNASGGIYYQLPELAVLSMDRSNANLKNEKAFHIIAGTSAYLASDLKLIVESYYKKFDDLLVRANSYDTQYSNNGTGWARGFDISLVKRFSGKYYAQTSYSYTVSKRDDHTGGGEYDYRYSKPHMFNILGGYQFNEEWSLTAKWMITSGLPTDDYVIHTDVLSHPNILRSSEEIVKRNGHRFDTNQSFDIRADYRKQFKYVALSIYLDIWNLFGTKNIASEEFLPQSGKFSSETLGMVPSFGFNIEF